MNVFAVANTSLWAFYTTAQQGNTDRSKDLSWLMSQPGGNIVHLLPRLAGDPSGLNLERLTMGVSGVLQTMIQSDCYHSLPLRSRCSGNMVAVKMILHCREKPLFGFVKTGAKSCLERFPSVPLRPTWTPTG